MLLKILHTAALAYQLALVVFFIGFGIVVLAVYGLGIGWLSIAVGVVILTGLCLSVGTL